MADPMRGSSRNSPFIVPLECRYWTVSSMHTSDLSILGKAMGSGGQPISSSLCGLWNPAIFLPAATPANFAGLFVFRVYQQMGSS